jgi:hypothetical protein
MPPRVVTTLALALVLVLVPTPARTGDAPRARDCASVLLTCVGYVTATEAAELPFRDGVAILALHNGELSSRTLSNDLVAAARDWGKTHHGRELTVRVADAELYSTPEDLARLIAEGGYGVVFVSEGMRGSVEEIARVAREARVLTSCVSRENVELGLAIGFVVVERRLVICLNRRAAAASGFQFRSALLRRATLVGEEGGH